MVSMLIWIGAEFSPIITYMYLGSLIASAIGVTFGIFILSVVIYYAARAWRLREGIDISIAFKEQEKGQPIDGVFSILAVSL